MPTATPLSVAAVPLGPVPADEREMLPDAEAARGMLYGLLGRLLLAPPDTPLLDTLAAWADPDPGTSDPALPLAAALHALGGAASLMPADAIAAEFAALFEAVGKPLLDPYASRFLTGALMDAPLARLRGDLSGFGLARRRGSVTEDHLGAIFEAMRLLVVGGAGAAPQPLAAQRRFFEQHLEGWADRCLDDIASAAPAVFYRCVAQLGRVFLAIERAGFELADDALPESETRR